MQSEMDLRARLEAAISKQDEQGAINAYEDLLLNGVNDTAIVNNLSYLYVNQGQIHQAVELLSKFEDRDDLSLLNQLGHLTKRLGELDRAMRVFEKAIALSPEDAETRNNFALVLFQRADFKAAESQLNIALQNKPDYQSALYNLALVLKAQNKMKACVASLEALLQVDAKHLQALFMMGKLALESGVVIEATDYFEKLLEIAPDNTDILASIASCLIDGREYTQAKPYCEKILKLEPDQYAVLYNLALIADKEGQTDRAISLYHSCLEKSPRYFNALNNLAALYLHKRDMVSAQMYFQRALDEQPDNKSVQYTLDAISGKSNVESAPKDYVKNLFNYYADHFDQHLVKGLDYQVPEILLKVFKKVSKPKEKAYDILDLGCGTGLVGEMFNPYSKSLTGVDLAENMLTKAREKQVYQHLHEDDLLHFLTHTSSQFDVALAADVLVYFGKLESLFEKLMQRLKHGGFFIFSIELCDGDTFLFQQSGRFAHSRHYITHLSKQFDLRVRYFKPVATRKQYGQSLGGAVVVLQR
jgi:predicted TPR repeat methyltransferase